MRRVLFLLLTWLAGAAPANARPWPCLPPMFEGGQRLHARRVEVFWLPPLLRQHELCWRVPAAPGELRVGLIGNSSVYGLPLPVELTVGGLLNLRFDASRTPAHFFNLAQVTPYQVRDAVVIQAVLPYQLDVIVYPMTVTEFLHWAPAPYPNYAQFFSANRGLVERMAEAPPAGLEEPFERYRASFDADSAAAFITEPLREIGAFARLAVRIAAGEVRKRLNSLPHPRPSGLPGRATAYDCDRTRMQNQRDFQNWQRWNILAYLEQLQRERDIPVLVVHWPVAHEPVGDCYNMRFTNALAAEFVDWLAAETRARGLAYLDLHDLLPNVEFIDSLHATALGHRHIADAIAPVLEPILEQRLARAGKPFAVDGGRSAR